MAAVTKRPILPVAVEKPTPYTFDLGMLLANDPNPVSINTSSPDSIEADLAALARDGTQALINQLLTTCAAVPTKDGVHLTLPASTTALPREKPLPTPREPTKWEKFAAKKGIKGKNRDERRNLAYDEATGEWRRRWGYQGLNKKGEEQDAWLVEVDPKKEAALKGDETIRSAPRRERKERVRREERKQRNNQRRAAEK